MSSIRVLIVDDSVVIRRVLTAILAADPAIEVVGAAATASIAFQKIAQSVPDVVVLDVDMPEMNGIDAVRRMRGSWPNLPVIMCSALTERGADTTLRALAAGAFDYVAKPSGLGRSDSATFATELVGKIKDLARRGPEPVVVTKSLAPAATARPEPITAIGIGCSTGGPNALGIVFASLPADIGVPIFIAQHMPPLFTKILADRLTAGSSLRVTEAVGGERVEPGRVYVAPGNFHMVVVREGTAVNIALNQDPPENSCRPAVDVLFRSLARVYGSGVLATVLTGMGHDGARGASEIAAAGGTMIVQSAASCVVASMPNSVADLGISSGSYPIEAIGPELALRVRRSHLPRARGQFHRLEL